MLEWSFRRARWWSDRCSDWARRWCCWWWWINRESLNRRCCLWRKWWHSDSRWHWDRILVDWRNELKVDVTSLGLLEIDCISSRSKCVLPMGIHRSADSRMIEEEDPCFLFCLSRELEIWSSHRLLQKSRQSIEKLLKASCSASSAENERESFIRDSDEKMAEKSDRPLLKHHSSYYDEVLSQNANRFLRESSAQFFRFFYLPGEVRNSPFGEIILVVAVDVTETTEVLWRMITRDDQYMIQRLADSTDLCRCWSMSFPLVLDLKQSIDLLLCLNQDPRRPPLKRARRSTTRCNFLSHWSRRSFRWQNDTKQTFLLAENISTISNCSDWISFGNEVFCKSTWEMSDYLFTTVIERQIHFLLTTGVIQQQKLLNATIAWIRHKYISIRIESESAWKT